jgi:hypothetical protein
MAESRVVFQGAGPFHLAGVQRATAQVLVSSVSVILYAILEGREKLEAINFQLVAPDARLLASRLLAAANQVEMTSGGSD